MVDFDDSSSSALIENEWPERPRRNIFYPPALLKALGWPSEKDRRAAADARFLDLLALRLALASRSRRSRSTTKRSSSRSSQLDEIPRARLSTVDARRHQRRSGLRGRGALERTAATCEHLGQHPRQWADAADESSVGGSPEFHGVAGPRPARVWSVSALETYLGCPFKFFAQHVLRLEEEPDDEEVMDPRRQGQFVHEVFEAFFRRGRRTGSGAITPGQPRRGAARVRRQSSIAQLERDCSDAEAGLERTRLLGSPAAAGLGEAVFRMEAERPVPSSSAARAPARRRASRSTTSTGPRDGRRCAARPIGSICSRTARSA